MTTSLDETLAGGSPVDWANDWLRVAQLPVTIPNVQVVYSWEFAESSGGGGMWNPLNTTEPWPSSTNFNSVGVKNYQSRNDGLAANALVIHNGDYPDVLACFERADNALATSIAIEQSPWGTHYLPLRPLPDPGPVLHPFAGDTMQLVESPHKPTLPGRRPTAKWDPATPNVVICENGCRIAGDQPDPNNPDQTLWHPVDSHGTSVVPPGAVGQGICAQVDKHGRPSGQGVTMLFSGSLTYLGEWS